VFPLTRLDFTVVWSGSAVERAAQLLSETTPASSAFGSWERLNGVSTENPMTKQAAKPTKSPRKRVAHKRTATSASKDAATPKSAASAPSKLDCLERALRTKNGATIPDLMEATGWQSHSVRGALAGALKRGRGLEITSEKINGERRYRIGSAK